MNQVSVPRMTRPKKRKAAPVIILRSVPAGFSWGWFTREDPRMHLQTVDSKNRNRYFYCIFRLFGFKSFCTIFFRETEFTERRRRWNDDLLLAWTNCSTMPP